MTTAEAYAFIKQMEQIYDSVRLVDTMNQSLIIVQEDGTLLRESIPCFAAWGNESRCESCVAAKTFATKKKLENYKLMNGEIYHVLTTPFVLNDRECVLELLLNESDNQTIEAVGRGQMIEMINGLNKRMYTDALTGVYNRKYYEEHLFTLKDECAIALIDLDDFGSVNQAFGHSVGDAALRAVANVIKHFTRESDVLIRYGGDEFLLAFHEIPKETFVSKMNSIREKIAGLILPEEPAARLSISIGCAYRGESSDVSFEQASQQLGIAKNNRNSVVIDDICMELEGKKTVAPMVEKNYSDGLLVKQPGDMQEIIRLFCRDYDGLFKLDISNGRRTIYQSAGAYAGWLRAGENMGYDEFRKAFAEQFMFAEERDAMLRHTSIDALRERMAEDEVFFENIRVVKNGCEQFYQIKFVRDPYDSNILIVGGHSVDSSTRSELRAWEERQTENAKETLLAKIVSERTEELVAKNKQLKAINEDIVDAVGNIVEARDAESGEHIRRVKGFTRILAECVRKEYAEYHLTEDDVNIIVSASALHDVGKIMIPDSILLKPGRLTPEEFDVIKTHSQKGCEILKKTSFGWSEEYLRTAMEICLCHHEKYDGRGYPNGLVGDKIPISAQIVSIADCYDALTTQRVYKAAIPCDEAYRMITNGECGAFSEKILHCLELCKDKFEEQAHSVARSKEEEAILSNIENLMGLNILLVEDNEINMDLMEDLLSQEGARLTKAYDGKQAVEACKQDTFDVILMDLIMPVMDGYEATKQIRKEHLADTTPIIAITACFSTETVERCMNIGMNGHVTKPIVMSVLSRTIIHHLNDKR